MTAIDAPQVEAPAVGSLPNDAPLVRVVDLWKEFRAPRSLIDLVRRPMGGPPAPALADVSLEVQSGEFLGLLGPNGAGKTTLLKILSTLIIPDRGSATVGGHHLVENAAEVRRIIAPVLANERSLYWRLSARENLELFAALLSIPHRDVSAAVDSALDVVGLADTGRKMVGQFSAGMMQRLLVGRALIGRPRVLLLDEPTRSLDPASAHAFRSFLREELSARRGCAVIVATHRTEEAFELCDRVLVLHRGRVVAEGRASELGAELVGSRYAVTTMEPNHAALEDSIVAGLARRVAVRCEERSRWWRVELEIEGSDDAAQVVLARLIDAGMPIARFERVLAPLADLIERAIGRSGRR
jgi:ABC-2 type transport system ATP-binding protein